MTKTLFMGELLMRLECEAHEKLLQADRLKIRYTGAEANAAVSFSRLSGKAAYAVSAVPANDLGERCLNFLREFGVSTDYCIRKEGRLGLFFLENGFSLRPSQVIYDRQGSVFAQTELEEYDIARWCRKGNWLHIGGTMPAQSSETRRLTEEVMSAAHQAGMTVSFDLNYRNALWSEADAAKTFRTLMPYTDILIANESVAEHFLEAPAAKLCEKYGFRYAALTRREEMSATVNAFSGVLYAGKRKAESRRREFTMLDRVGGGDAFAGAILCALQENGRDLQSAVDFAAAAACLKHTVAGDFNLVSRKDVEELLARNTFSVRR